MNCSSLSYLYYVVFAVLVLFFGGVAFKFQQLKCNLALQTFRIVGMFSKLGYHNNTHPLGGFCQHVAEVS